MSSLDALSVELNGPAVIEASAGTGKTYTITTLVLRLILERDLRLSEILVVTYTRAATAELRERIRVRLAEALRAARGQSTDDETLRALLAASGQRLGAAGVVTRLDRALASLDEAPVHTIHAFCQRLLGDHAFEAASPFGLELLADAAPLLDEIACDYYGRELATANEEQLWATSSEAPEGLHGLYNKAAAAVAVLPTADELASGAKAAPVSLADYRAQARVCAELWAAHAAEVAALLTPIHARNHLPRWLELIGDLFQRPPGVVKANRPCLTAFTPAGIAKKAKDRAPEHPFFAAVARFVEIDEALASARERERVMFQRGFLQFAGSELQRRTDALNARTFDGLLKSTSELLASPRGEALVEAVRGQYRAALIDEFQDTDPLQHHIFTRLFAHGGPLLMIGDPKQAIYGFRGADVHAYLKARSEVGERIFTLDQNFRSDASSVAAINALYGAVEQPFATPGIDYHPVRAARPDRLFAADGRAPIDLAYVAVEGGKPLVTLEIAERVASDIARLLMSGAERVPEGAEGQRRALEPRDIAVLCRTNNEASRMHTALAEAGLPAVLTGDASVFESEDATEIERLLVAMAEPGDARALRSMLASFYVGFDAARLSALDEDDEAWDWHRAQLFEIHQRWLKAGLTPAIAELLHRYDVEQQLVSRPDGMRRLTNLWHLVELLTRAAHEEHLGMLGVIRVLREMRHDRALRAELVGDAHELRLESSEDAVLVTTIHKSKGLEFPLVYCPFSYDGNLLFRDDQKSVRFHDPARQGQLTLDLGSQDFETHKKLAEQEALAEALRVLYVALTRAKHRVTVIVPPPDTSQHKGSALAYLLHGGGPLEALKERLGGLEPPAFVNALEERVQRSAGKLSLRQLGPERSRYERRALDKSAPFVALKARRVLEATVRTTSFSALTSGLESSFVRDHDLLSAETPAAPEPSELALAEFPRGARGGELLHEILEHCDFGDDEAALLSRCRSVLAARGFAAELAPALARDLADVLVSELVPGLSLSTLTQDKRLSELEFMLPIEGALSPKGLSRRFQEHGAPAAAPSYAARLEALRFAELRGYLRGFIDLVFEHEGRFYLIDYKSNDLGKTRADYSADALCTAMSGHHYFLQYHLYLVALHRHLRARLPDYAYETHIGGVFYLFLRGMSPKAPGAGVFHDRPSAALIEALDAWLAARESMS